ncbi:MAG: hypothetical protein M3O67_04600 [Bacteroidota bacterium]|nr:hypothetical protein [Bacteroidota bacterium]
MKTRDVLPYMKSFSMCLREMVREGYTDNFRATDKGLCSLITQKFYLPKAYTVVNYFLFEGMFNPNENAMIYVIETEDGLKGTMVDISKTSAD